MKLIYINNRYYRIENKHIFINKQQNIYTIYKTKKNIYLYI